MPKNKAIRGALSANTYPVNAVYNNATFSRRLIKFSNPAYEHIICLFYKLIKILTTCLSNSLLLLPLFKNFQKTSEFITYSEARLLGLKIHGTKYLLTQYSTVMNFYSTCHKDQRN
jgi:hypothetical protein